VKRFVAFSVLLLLSLPATAVDNGRVKYAGGTVPGVSAGVVGRFDTTSETSLTFEYAGKTLAIPYASIESFDHAEVVARHLGVLPAIVVGLLKARQHRHFFRISYLDPNRGPNLGESISSNGHPNGVAQVAVFEVPKHMPRPLQAVLDARAPHDAYHPHSDKSCIPCAGEN
jgi:hypothetical protein